MLLIMKRINLFILLSALAFGAQAQQLTASSFYDMAPVLHNPAAAGTQNIDGKHFSSLGGTFRKQWDGVPGGPQTGLVFGSTYLEKAKIGVGGYLYNDKTGPLTYNGLQLSVNYQIPMKNNAVLSLGLEGRAQQFQYDRAKLAAVLGPDNVLASDDKRLKGDAGFGVAYTARKWQLGASVSQLIQSRLDLYSGTGNVVDESKMYRHYYAHGNYQWDVDKVTTIIPNLLVIYLPNAPTTVQGGVRVEHNDLFWYGLTRRSEQSWMLSAGLHIKQKFNIGYSFDIYNKPIGIFDKGSNAHEVMLRYDFIR